MKNKKQQFDESFTIKIASSLDEIEQIRPIWQGMQSETDYPIINSDIDRFITVIRTSKETLIPYVMVVEQHGEPVAMVIAHLKKEPFRINLGHQTLFKPVLKTLSITYGGFIGQSQVEFAALMIHELIKMLRQRDFDVICFNHLREDSSFYQLVRTMPGVLSRGYCPEVRPLWTMGVTGSVDSFYQARSKKHRANLRRYIRKLEKEYRDRVEIITYTQDDQLDVAVKNALKVSKKTYQYAFGTGFRDDILTRSMLTTASKQGWLRLSVMYIDKEPCAYQLGFHYGKAYILEQIGFDPKWGKSNIGTVLFLRVLEDIFENSQIEIFDFSFYDYEYKRSYSDAQCLESSPYIFATRFFPVTVNVLRTCVIAFSNLLKSIMAKAGIFDFVRKYRRAIVEKKNRKNQSRVKLDTSNNQGQKI